MKKVFFILLTLLLAGGSQSLATKWIELNPEKVESRAQVIVLGTYNFKSKPKSSKGNFYGRQFHVEKVYKGEAAETITAGIDIYDTGWAEELQQDGGKLLLLLEKRKEARFLVPVAGPNGMVQVQDGRILSGHEGFYGKILSGEARTPIPAKSIEGGGHLLEILLFSLTGFITLLFILSFLARENTKSY
ncbi:hypothetical protein AF332_25660 [Sporosarcina globispora]|uniref:CbiN domain protein n=1 Tax=Sporosarcina globispora TaxID=1459 RepID=A0A0M0GIW9_SPOGL|nr:hypothetical protein [Sporosarcina globispora]KON89870.1 hypothetical protein AF332_25660 [Sporosarcina globispora]